MIRAFVISIIFLTYTTLVSAACFPSLCGMSEAVVTEPFGPHYDLTAAMGQRVTSVIASRANRARRLGAITHRIHQGGYINLNEAVSELFSEYIYRQAPNSIRELTRYTLVRAGLQPHTMQMSLRQAIHSFLEPEFITTQLYPYFFRGQVYTLREVSIQRTIEGINPTGEEFIPLIGNPRVGRLYTAQEVRELHARIGILTSPNNRGRPIIHRNALPNLRPNGALFTSAYQLYFTYREFLSTDAHRMRFIENIADIGDMNLNMVALGIGADILDLLYVTDDFEGDAIIELGSLALQEQFIMHARQLRDHGGRVAMRRFENIVRTMNGRAIR